MLKIIALYVGVSILGVLIL